MLHPVIFVLVVNWGSTPNYHFLHASNKRADHFFEFLYADVWGPAPSSSLSGSRYVVVFIVTVDIHGSFFFVPNLKFLIFFKR
jgi:hypothetical protein